MKKKRKSSRKPSEVYTRINVKLSKATFQALRTKARKYAGGNISALLRHSALTYSPKKGAKLSVKV